MFRQGSWEWVKSAEFSPVGEFVIHVPSTAGMSGRRLVSCGKECEGHGQRGKHLSLRHVLLRKNTQDVLHIGRIGLGKGSEFQLFGSLAP